MTSSDQGKVDDKDRVPGEEGTHPCLTAVLEKWDALARETNEIKAKCFQN